MTVMQTLCMNGQSNIIESKHIKLAIQRQSDFHIIVTRKIKGNETCELTCINQTALSSPLSIPLKIAAAKEDIYSGSSTGGVFSSKVSLHEIFIKIEVTRMHGASS